MNEIACCSKLMEPKGAAQKFMTLLEAGIWLSVIICDGDVTAIEEIRKAIDGRWPGIAPAVSASSLPELQACINHKVMNMRWVAVPLIQILRLRPVAWDPEPCIHHQT